MACSGVQKAGKACVWEKVVVVVVGRWRSGEEESAGSREGHACVGQQITAHCLSFWSPFSHTCPSKTHTVC